MINNYRTNPSSLYIADIRPVFPRRSYTAPRQPRDPQLYAAMLPAKHARAYSNAPIGELARTHELKSLLDTSNGNVKNSGPARVQPPVWSAEARRSRSAIAQILHIAHSRLVKAGAVIIIVLATGAFIVNLVTLSQDGSSSDTSKPIALSGPGKPITSPLAVSSTPPETSGQPADDTAPGISMAHNGGVSIGQPELSQQPPSAGPPVATSLNSASTAPSVQGIPGSASVGELSGSLDQEISNNNPDKGIDQGTEQTTYAAVQSNGAKQEETTKKPPTIPILGGILDKLGL